MKDAKAAMESLTQKIEEQLARDRAEQQAKIEAAKERITERPEYKELDAEKQQHIIADLEREKQNVQQQRYIANIRSTETKRKDLVAKSLNELQKMTATAAEPPAEYISKAKLKFNFTKSELTTKEDVEAYTAQLKAEMLRHIESNRRILL